jgi:hypothetical protein
MGKRRRGDTFPCGAGRQEFGRVRKINGFSS